MVKSIMYRKYHNTKNANVSKFFFDTYLQRIKNRFELYIWNTHENTI